MPLLQVKHLTKIYKKKFLTIKALDDVSFSIEKAKTVSVVGSSGSGKTTLAKALLRLCSITSGEVFFENKNIFSLKKHEIKTFRKKMQIVFQNPFSSLNPRMTIEEILSEPLIVHNISTPPFRPLKIFELLDMVQLSKQSLEKYPHEFSGGQRQRIVIARALATNPTFLILDEPISSLDLFIQMQLIDLLSELQKKLSLTYLFIAHDLYVVKCISDEIFVMHKGKIVEKDTPKKIFSAPSHHYTQQLIDAHWSTTS